MGYTTIPSKILYKFTDDITGESTTSEMSKTPDNWIGIDIRIDEGEKINHYHLLVSDTNPVYDPIMNAIERLYKTPYDISS